MFTGSLNMPNTFKVQVNVTNNRGFTPEEIASRCVEQILEISDTAPPAIKEQALEYKNNLTQIITHYIKEAVRSDRTTVYNAIKDSGNIKLAEYIRRL